MTPKKKRKNAHDLRGAGKLAVDATTRITGVYPILRGWLTSEG